MVSVIRRKGTAPHPFPMFGSGFSLMVFRCCGNNRRSLFMAGFAVGHIIFVPYVIAWVADSLF
jgi:hypothetical protein